MTPGYGEVSFERPSVKARVRIDQGSDGADKNKSASLGTFVRDGYNTAWTSDARFELTPDHIMKMVSHEGMGRGGVIFFDDSIKPEALRTVLGVMGVKLGNPRYPSNDFKVFHLRSQRARTLNEFRFVTRQAMVSLFKEKEEVPDQEVDLFEAIWAIMEHERQLHPDHGEDGITSTCFGFMVENGSYGVYRFWSWRVFQPK